MIQNIKIFPNETFVTISWDSQDEQAFVIDMEYVYFFIFNCCKQVF